MKTLKEIWEKCQDAENPEVGISAIREFTQQHVEAALKAAIDNGIGQFELNSLWYEDKNPILNAYPLDQIK